MTGRAVTFDLWNTLIVDDRPEERSSARLAAICRLLEAAGVTLARERAEALFEEASDLLWADGVLEDLGPGGQAREFLRRAGRDPVSDAALAAGIARELGDAILAYPPVLLPGAAETLEAVGSRVPVGLVSNTGYTPGRALREILAGFGVLRRFGALAFSDEVGWRKPDARIFRRTLDALDLDPARTLHVGDHLDADVRGAKALGMRTLWLAPAGDWAAAAVDALPPHLRPDFVAPSVADARPLLDAWIEGAV